MFITTRVDAACILLETMHDKYESSMLIVTFNWNGYILLPRILLTLLCLRKSSSGCFSVRIVLA